MCEPTTILLAASVILAATSASLTIVGQRQQAATQEEYQQRLMDANAKQMMQNRELATESFLAQTAQEYKRLGETREASSAATLDKSIEGDKARGAVMAAAADAGAGGVSLTGLLNDFHRQEATFGLRYATNLEYRADQTDFNVSTLRSQAQSRILSIAPYQGAPIKPVDYAGPLLQATASGLNAYSTKIYYDKLGTQRPVDRPNIPGYGPGE
jgi:hypothetical protein